MTKNDLKITFFHVLYSHFKLQDGVFLEFHFDEKFNMYVIQYKIKHILKKDIL